MAECTQKLRAQAALDDAWKQVKPMIEDGDRERERTRLSCIVASLVMLALDEEDSIDRALTQYRAGQ